MSAAGDFGLDRSLPPDVVANEFGIAAFYEQYAVFSWPWCWRRTLVLAPLAALGGALLGIWHAMMVQDWWEAAGVAWRMALAYLLMIAAGVALAALIRHRGLPRRAERALIVVAIFVGMVIALAGNRWADRFHTQAMRVHATQMAEGAAMVGDHAFVRLTLDAIVTFGIFFVAGGGLALRPYFTEPGRWREHRNRLELEALRLKKNAADLRLTVLQAQVEPHFLFNTLASVRSLVRSEPQRAEATIDALVEHLRATLPRLREDTGTALSTLAEQFDICASYLALMRVRMGSRLRTTIDLPENLRGVPCPPLVLISLVENSIKHGIEPKSGTAHVELRARVGNESGRRFLEVAVTDDGAGLSLGMGQGTGLANIRAQLRARFADEASLKLAQRDGGGVTATLKVPLELPET